MDRETLERFRTLYLAGRIEEILKVLNEMDRLRSRMSWSGENRRGFVEDRIPLPVGERVDAEDELLRLMEKSNLRSYKEGGKKPDFIGVYD